MWLYGLSSLFILDCECNFEYVSGPYIDWDRQRLWQWNSANWDWRSAMRNIADSQLTILSKALLPLMMLRWFEVTSQRMRMLHMQRLPVKRREWVLSKSWSSRYTLLKFRADVEMRAGGTRGLLIIDRHDFSYFSTSLFLVSQKNDYLVHM